ncbi:dienelactone hydrolase family protein [Pseudanabaena sp. FACHB-2040]|uniref:dienelactone hydrolase family protein n=1 Tax=Pseudanabaena sp. FACHB-2040 TaxID=2692859 RepID=UPI0016896720|nr:dienelactone hydrolase family protein [Pseudanabaena sp. FACHB-2040]MBD2259590.1 dienelactone hydrolase family protein [Pseudanabaena sp. FACHB-2040]
MGTDVAGLGYLALPEAGSGAGVIVLQEWWGLVPHIKSVADRFAQAGFVALAPDLYGGEKTTSPDEAGRLMMALNIEKTAQDLENAVDYLLQHDAVVGTKVGVVGFCMGGQLALLAATISDRIGAAIDFYGIHPNVKLNVSQLRAPVLGLFGDQDTFVPLEAVEDLVATVRHAGKPIETHLYSGAGHAFFNDARPEAYNEAAAADAWVRSLDFFHEHLVG